MGKTWSLGAFPRVLASEGGPINNASVVAGSYGFGRFAAIARLIEENARQGNRRALDLLVEQYEAHLAKVQVAFK